MKAARIVVLTVAVAAGGIATTRRRPQRKNADDAVRSRRGRGDSPYAFDAPGLRQSAGQAYARGGDRA